MIIVGVSFLDRFGVFGDPLRLAPGSWNKIAIVVDVGVGVDVIAGRDRCGGSERDHDRDHDYGRKGE